MLKIGDFSKLSRVSVRMLRYYDDLGLLTPAVTDRSTGYRYYNEDQLPTAGRIAALRDMGFGLAAAGELLRHYEDRTLLEARLLVQRRELLELHSRTQQRLRLLDTALQRLRKDETMNYNVTIKTLPQRYAAAVRMVLPAYEAESLLWRTMNQETAALHLQPDDPCICSVVFLDAEYKETDVDVEAQKTVRGQYPDTEHVRFKTLPPVRFASATYQGPYEKINGVNEAVAAWVRDNGYEFDGPAFNIYHVSPHETQDPEEYVTEVCYPVKHR